MGVVFTFILIGVLLTPIWWIYDNTVDGDEDRGYKFFALIMSVIIGGGLILLFVLPNLLSAIP